MKLEQADVELVTVVVSNSNVATTCLIDVKDSWNSIVLNIIFKVLIIRITLIRFLRV